MSHVPSKRIVGVFEGMFGLDFFGVGIGQMELGSC